MKTKTVNGYTVTDDGRIFSRYGHELRQRTNPKGYKLVSWCVQGPRRSEGVFVHRIVAQAFVPNPMPLFFTQINHIDGNPTNNHAGNLEWCDCLHNNRDKMARRRAAGLPVSCFCKPVTYCGVTYESIADMARAFHIRQKTLRESIRRGKWRGHEVIVHPSRREVLSADQPRRPWGENFPFLCLPTTISIIKMQKLDFYTIRNEALKYSSLSDFIKFSYNAYNWAVKYNVIALFTWLKRDTHIWNYENVLAVAKKFSSTGEFNRRQSSAWNAARRNGWLQHFTWMRRGPLIKHTKSHVMECSRKYAGMGRKAFQRGDVGAYHVALKNGWLDEMTWLLPSRNPYKESVHCVYKYYFKDFNTVYIGLTMRKDERDNAHRSKNKSAVYRFAIAKGVDVPPMIVIADGLSMPEAQRLEAEYVARAQNDGCMVLNSAKVGVGVGSLGSLAGEMSKDEVFAVARKYHRRWDFGRGNPAAYGYALKYKWLDEMDWMPKRWMPKRSPTRPKAVKTRRAARVWMRDELVAETKKYSSRQHFREANWAAYSAALKMGVLDEVLPAKNAPRKVFAYREGSFVSEYQNAYEAARQLGICRVNVVQCCKGRRRQIHGYRFQYE